MDFFKVLNLFSCTGNCTCKVYRWQNLRTYFYFGPFLKQNVRKLKSWGWFHTFFWWWDQSKKYLLRLSHLYRDHLYWLIFTLIASRGCCHVVLFTFTFRGVFEFAYLLFNVFSHFDTFFCFMPISLSMFPNSKLLAMK